MSLRSALALLMTLSTACLAADPAPELTVYYYQRMPFFGNVNGRESGVLIDISRLIFDQAGITYNFVNVPVIRFFESLKKSENSCIPGPLKTKAREAVYSYSDDFIYQDQPFRIIVNANKRKTLPERPTIKQVLESELRLGVIDGYAYGDWLDGKIVEYRPRLQKINIGNETGKMHRMIIAGRFDYMFSVDEEARYVMAKNRQHAVRLSIVEIADAPMGNTRYLLCSKGIDSATMMKINRAIKNVKSSRAYEELVNRKN